MTETLFLGFAVRDIGSSCCVGFDGHSYTGSFKGFDSEKVIDGVVRIIPDERLKKPAGDFAEMPHRSLYGQFYTYDACTHRLSFSSRWGELEGELSNYLGGWEG